MEKLSFAITLASTGTPYALVHINDRLIDDSIIHEEKIITFEVECGEENKLNIELGNKKESDVVLDDEGNVIKDQLLHIKKIEIDEIDITNLCRFKSKYIPSDRWYAENHPDTPVLRNHMDLGWNGVWFIEFNTPFYIFLLENM